jgi:hypothetical protein
MPETTIETTCCSRGVNELETLFEIRYLVLLFTPGTVLFQCEPNSIKQILVAKWFGEEFDRPSWVPLAAFVARGR